LRRINAPFGVEVVGDPYEVFSAGVFQHPLRPVFRWWFTRQQRRQCAYACGAAYVTQYALQRRYPCESYAIGVSDVEIKPEAYQPIPVMATHHSTFELGGPDFAGAPQQPTSSDEPLRVITVGTLAQPYKGIDVLI